MVSRSPLASDEQYLVGIAKFWANQQSQPVPGFNKMPDVAQAFGAARTSMASSQWSLNPEKDMRNLKASTLQAMTKLITPIKLTFSNLNYSVRVKSTKDERRY